MLVVMRAGSSETDIDEIRRHAQAAGVETNVIHGAGRTVVGLGGSLTSALAAGSAGAFSAGPASTGTMIEVSAPPSTMS